MGHRARRIEWLVWGGLILIILTLLMAFLLAQLRLRQALGKPLTVIGQVAPFTLTNQLGRAFSLSDLRGQVWVADIIFTTCPGPCTKMSRAMRDLQNSVPANSRTKFVSLTTYPDHDTPPVLKEYGQRFEADPSRWIFLTGTKTDIASLARDSLKLTNVEKPAADRESPDDLFIHSTIFVIVDKQGQLRGVFETTGDDIDPQKVKATILAAIRRLERES
jgi:protein SCO1/2